MVRRMLITAAMLLLPLVITACACTQVHEQALTGAPSQERHATGMDSQVADHP